MKKSHVVFSLLVISLLAMMALISCSSDNTGSPTATTGSAGGLVNYAHMNGGSTVVGGQQYNWAISDSPFPYGEWIYAEVNQQSGEGLDPGEGQVNVQLGDVQFAFTGLSSKVTEVVAAIKDHTDDGSNSYTELGRYVPMDGAVTIPVAYPDLVSYFGFTHYSVWFKVLGAKNKKGVTDGTLEIIGSANGTTVNLMQNVQHGSAVVPIYFWVLGAVAQSCDDACAASMQVCVPAGFVELEAVGACTAMLTRLGIPTGTVTLGPLESGSAAGCRWMDNGASDRWVYQNVDGLPATACNATWGIAQRACPCQPM